MNRSMTYSLLPLAALILSGSMAVSQPPATDQTAPPPAGASDTAQPPTPPSRPDMMARKHEMMRGRMGDRRHEMDGGPMGGPFHFGPGGMWWKNPMVVQRLSLTPEQVKRMDDIFQQSRLQLIDLKANVEKQEVLLEPMISANPIDTAKAQAQIDKIADARADLEKANAKMLLGIRGVLTADQWTKLSERHFGGPGSSPASGPGRTHGPRPGRNTDNMTMPPMEP